jgi:hypothetical protein
MSDDPVSAPGSMPLNTSTNGGGGNEWRGNSRKYLLRRLKEAGRQDLVDAVEARRISARSAAIGLGWLTEEPRASKDPRIQRRLFARTQAFGGPQPSRLLVLEELWLGPHPDTGSIFRSREELVAAWKEHGPECMAKWGVGGRRPCGWYELEGPPDLHRVYATERSTLYERGLLGIDEAAQLEHEWRQGFDEAQALSTDAEREQHYREIDLPKSLRKRWEKAERRRRERTRGSTDSAKAQEMVAK